MATIVNTTPAASNSSGMGFFMGMIVLLVIVLLTLYFGIPLLRSATTNKAPSITVPDKIDVNVNQPNSQ